MANIVDPIFLGATTSNLNCDYLYVGKGSSAAYVSYDLETVMDYMDFMSSMMGLMRYSEYQDLSKEEREKYKKTVIRDKTIYTILNEDR